MAHDVGVTLPPIADRMRFVFVAADCAYGLTTDGALAQSAREHGYLAKSYQRTTEGPTEWEIFLAKREPEGVDEEGDNA